MAQGVGQETGPKSRKLGKDLLHKSAGGSQCVFGNTSPQIQSSSVGL